MTPFEMAQRFVGVKEIAEQGKDHPLIQWGFMLCGFGTETPDSTPWCSAFMQIPFHLLGLPRSRDARARSWLKVGTPIDPWTVDEPQRSAAAYRLSPAIGYDVVILKRGAGDQPGPDVIEAPGHVGLFAGFETRGGTASQSPARYVHVLGGNQGDAVSLATFPWNQILGIRRVGIS